jgi:hypothetical protein
VVEIFDVEALMATGKGMGGGQIWRGRDESGAIAESGRMGEVVCCGEYVWGAANALVNVWSQL